jgi:hypothetical protein
MLNCPAVALSCQDGRHSAVALLLKAVLIQVSDYRLLGASGLIFYQYFSYIMAVSFIGGGHRSTRRKTTNLTQVTDNLYHIM